jgi:hypothetical protein
MMEVFEFFAIGHGQCAAMTNNDKIPSTDATKNGNDRATLQQPMPLMSLLATGMFHVSVVFVNLLATVM